MIKRFFKRLENFLCPWAKYEDFLNNWHESSDNCPRCTAPLLIKSSAVADWIEYDWKCEYCGYEEHSDF